MGESNPNGGILVKQDEFTAEDQVTVTASERTLLDSTFGSAKPV